MDLDSKAPRASLCSVGSAGLGNSFEPYPLSESTGGGIDIR
jgi:hypothetical protein